MIQCITNIIPNVSFDHKNDAKCDIKQDVKDYDAIEDMEADDKKDDIKYNMKEIDTIDDNVASCIIHVTLNANLNCCVDCNNRE